MKNKSWNQMINQDIIDKQTEELMLSISRKHMKEATFMIWDESKKEWIMKRPASESKGWKPINPDRIQNETS